MKYLNLLLLYDFFISTTFLKVYIFYGINLVGGCAKNIFELYYFSFAVPTISKMQMHQQKNNHYI
jgi:hypothetical protein